MLIPSFELFLLLHRSTAARLRAETAGHSGVQARTKHF